MLGYLQLQFKCIFHKQSRSGSGNNNFGSTTLVYSHVGIHYGYIFNPVAYILTFYLPVPISCNLFSSYFFPLPLCTYIHVNVGPFSYV
jgi:hypothetical protein